LHQAGQFDAAAVSYERALAIAPDAIEVVCNFCGLMQRVCDWEQLAKWTPRVVQAIREGRPGVPLGLLVAQPRCSPELQLAAARANARDWDRTPAVAASPRSDHGRVRVGYLSADFREHATAWLTAELFELHDRADFDVALLSYGPDEPSAIRARLRNASDRFVDLHGFDDDAAARVVAELGLDVLVDLNGNTDNGRMGIVARRPAPVQVNWLGFPGTLGARCYDYMIADHHIVPDGCDRWYSEAVVRLPECYQCNDRLRSCPAESPPRAALGLPEAAVVLGCFNQAFKITPDMFSLWMRVLRAVPESVLWLLEDNAKATASLRSRASDAGVDPGRLAFAPRLGHQAHLQRYRAMDLALDTFPCTSHTTGSDALWMDCPLITVTGDTFAARVATSLVRNAGVPELASPSLEDHERTVLALARAPDELRALRSRLHAGRFREPLFDTPRFVAHFETALRTMADRARAGLSPQAFAVPRRP